jgi:hypothetical protein
MRDALAQLLGSEEFFMGFVLGAAAVGSLGWLAGYCAGARQAIRFLRSPHDHATEL